MMNYDDFKNPLRTYYFEKKQDSRTTSITISQNDKVLDAVYATWKHAYIVGDRVRPSAEAFLVGYLRDTLPSQMHSLELIIKIPNKDSGHEEGNVVELCAQHARTATLVKEAIKILCDHGQYERAHELLSANHQVVYTNQREQTAVSDLIATARQKAEAAVRETAERKVQAAAQAAIERATREAEEAERAKHLLARKAAHAAQAVRADHEPHPAPTIQRKKAPARKFPTNPIFFIMAALAMLTLVFMYVSSGKESNTLPSSTRGLDRSEDFLKRLWEGRLRPRDMDEIVKYTKLTSDQMIDIKTVNALVNLINDSVSDAMLTKVLLALAQIIDGNLSPEDVTHPSEAGCQALVNAGITTRLIESLPRHKSQRTDAYMIHIISNLAASQAGAQEMTTSHFIENLVPLLATIKEPAVKVRALRAVSNLAGQSDLAPELLIQAGAIPLALSALEGGHADLENTGLGTIINLIRSEAAALAFVRENGVEALGISLNSADFSIQKNAAVALGNLAIYTPGIAAIKGDEKLYQAVNKFALSDDSIIKTHAGEILTRIFAYSMSQPQASPLTFAVQERNYEEQTAPTGPHA